MFFTERGELKDDDYRAEN
jgi:hypothetical protein